VTEEQKFEIGRSTAMQMVVLYGNVIWASFNSILVANAALVAVSGLVGTSSAFRPQLPAWTGGVLAIAGLIVCFVWICIVLRHFAYQDYYFACAKFYEDKLLNELKVINLGAIYGGGGKVLVGKYSLQMQWLPGKLKIQYLAIGTIAVFALLYLLILVFSIV
jgi:hypothetical protein